MQVLDKEFIDTQADIQDVRLTVLYDNYPLVPDLQTSSGFACLVAVGEKTILFDAGRSGEVLLENMEVLGMEPDCIDLIVISHHAHNHIGGLEDILRFNRGTQVYIPRTFPNHISEHIKRLGGKPNHITDSGELCPNLFVLSEMCGYFSEQALAVRSARGLVLLTGCGHPGIDRLVARVREYFPDEPIYLALGGFHLKLLPDPEIARAVRRFLSQHIQKVAPCHCSGQEARKFFREAYGENYIEIGVGGIVDIPVEHQAA